MFYQIFCGHAVFVGEGHCAFQHGVLYDALDVYVVDCFVYVIFMCVESQVGADGVAHVVDVELSFDVKVKWLVRDHVFDVRHFTFEGCFVYRQEIVLLCADS